MTDSGAADSPTEVAGEPVVIAPMRLRHLRGVVHIERATSHRPWSTTLFQGELKLTARYYVVALAGSTVVGYGGLMFTGYEAHLTLIATHPDHQRRQIATRVLWVLFAECRRRGVEDITLEVRLSNTGAQELYRRFGLAPGGIRPKYYAEVNEDALIMWSHDLGSESMGRRLIDIAEGFRSPLVTTGLE